METGSTLAVAAHLLDYPHPWLAEEARAAADWLEPRAPDAGALARRFAADLAKMPPGEQEEAYTAAFDFSTTGTLYAGEHLFGASWTRAEFLARLRGLQREYGVGASPELPDHLAELLRLAAAMEPGDERDELLRDAVLPTARAALAPLESAGHPFASALGAVVKVVEAAAPPLEDAELRASPSAAIRGIGALPVVDDGDGDRDLFEPSPEASR